MKTPIDVVKHIVEINACVSHIAVSPYKARPHLHERKVKKDFVKEALLHETRDYVDFLKRENVLHKEAIEKELLSLAPDCRLSVHSYAVTSTAPRFLHIPLVDFKPPPSDKNLKAIREAMKAVGEKSGVILISGESYHYYGFELMEPHNWLKFMSRLLLLNDPITKETLVDSRWVAHRLIDGFGALRISPKENGAQNPYVVAEL